MPVPRFAALLTLLAGFLWAQDPEPLALPRISGPIVLDGLSNEPAWEAIAPLPLTLNAPIFRGEPTERTEIRIAYDADYIYLAGRLYDSDPEAAGAADLSRDSFTPNNDYFGLVLDTFNDNENALGFFTTPAGIRWDGSIFNDAEGDLPINVSWNTFWDVAVVQNGEGWFAELRIPFFSLRFQDVDGQVTMGLTTWRYISRKSETVAFPAMDPRTSSWSLFKPSLFRKIHLEGVSPRNPVIITPYGLGGVGLTAELNESGSAYVNSNDLARAVGLDVKYSLTSNLTLDLTANTDFAQVEADDEQVNLTRFDLFFPEKRLFFQERASIFDLSLGGPIRLFYSRRIGIHEGLPVPIYGGARLVGRLGEWDLGLMNMQTAPVVSQSADIGALPSENFGVLRLRRRVLNPYSYAGGMVTSRVGTDGHANRAYALDGILRVVGDNYLLLSWAQTSDSGTPAAEAPSALDAARLHLSWERRTLQGLGIDLSFSRQGADFDPQMGFLGRTDYLRLGSELAYGWFPADESPVLNQSLGLDASAFFSNSDGKVESAVVGPRWNVGLKSGLSAFVGISLVHEALQDTFILDTDGLVFVPAAAYNFVQVNASYSSRTGRPVFLFAGLEVGGFYDGWLLSVSLDPTWTITRNFELSGGIVSNTVRFPGRGPQYDTQVLRLRMKATLSTALSFSTFAQINTAANGVIINGRFRYNPREGTDLYVVYNHGLNTRRGRKDPALPLTESSTLLLKYSTSFLPGLASRDR